MKDETGAAFHVCGRREFLRAMGRRVGLGVLVTGMGALVMRRGAEGNAVDEVCRRGVGCGECGLFEDCNLERARAARNMAGRPSPQPSPGVPGEGVIAGEVSDG